MRLQYSAVIQAGHIVQAAALVVTVGTGLVTGYVTLQSEISKGDGARAALTMRMASVEIRLDQEIAKREASNQLIGTKVDGLSTQLATISAQLGDLKDVLGHRR